MRARILAAWRRNSPTLRVALWFLLLVAGLVLVRVWQRDRQIEPEATVTLTNFRRLHLGMTEGQVEAILGVGKAKTSLHRVLQYEDNGCQVEITYLDSRAIAGQCKIQRRAEGLTREQVEAILADGDRSIKTKRWRWYRDPKGPTAAEGGVEFLSDRERATHRMLTKNGCLLLEELRKPPSRASLIE
jgi:hypothetical protein